MSLMSQSLYYQCLLEEGNSYKYQGQEMGNIIMSVVYDPINKFSDDSDLLNVAIF